MPRALVVAEWDDEQEPFPSRKKPGSYSPATRLPGGSRKAGEMTITGATEEDVAELTGRLVPRRPLQRGDNPVADTVADVLTHVMQLYGPKAVDWVIETGGPKAWAWGKGVVTDWKARRARGAAEPTQSVEVEPVVEAEPLDVEEAGIGRRGGAGQTCYAPVRGGTAAQSGAGLADCRR